MTKASHTPGPWDSSDEWEGIYVHARQALKIVCEVAVTNPNYADPRSHISNAEALANARLIAAAPDLLARLHDLTIWAGHRPDGRGSWAYVNACVTLCRATGQEYQDTHYPPIAKAKGT
jgi:hypothetical protein